MSYFHRPSRERFDPFDPRHSRDLVTTSMPGETELLRCKCGDPVEVQARELPDLWAGRIFPNCSECRRKNAEHHTTTNQETPSP